MYGFKSYKRSDKSGFYKYLQFGDLRRENRLFFLYEHLKMVRERKIIRKNSLKSSPFFCRDKSNSIFSMKEYIF